MQDLDDIKRKIRNHKEKEFFIIWKMGYFLDINFSQIDVN